MITACCSIEYYVWDLNAIKSIVYFEISLAAWGKQDAPVTAFCIFVEIGSRR